MSRNRPKNIVIFSPPRTGSILIYNIIKILFDDGWNHIKHTHLFEYHTNNYYIVTYRDFRDSFLSFFRVQNIDINIDTLKKQEPLRQYAQLKEYLNKPNALLLRYESFYNDYDYVFDNFEKFFIIKINDKKREEVYNKINLNKAKEITSNLKDFQDIHGETQLHGEHIYHPEPGYWKEFDLECQEYITEKLKVYLEEWKYI